MSTKQTAVRRAIALLDAVGASYCVITDDGKRYGALEVVTPRPAKAATEKRDFFSYTNQFLASLKEGETVNVPVLPDHPWTVSELQSNIASYSVRHWGKGNFVTCIVREPEGEYVEVLRVS